MGDKRGDKRGKKGGEWEEIELGQQTCTRGNSPIGNIDLCAFFFLDAC